MDTKDLKNDVGEPPQQIHPSGPTETPVPETRRCSCGVAVPEGKGKCPTCGKFQPANQVAVTHGLRRAALTPKEFARHEEVMAELFADCGGRDRVDVFTKNLIVEYGVITVHIERIDNYLAEIGTLTKAGKQPAAMTSRLALGARRDQIATRIREQVPVDARSSTSGVSAMPREALGEMKALLQRQAQGETLSDRELGQLDVLRDAARGALALPPDPTHTFERVALPGFVDGRSLDGQPAPAVAVPVAASPCKYCGGRPCIGESHPAFETLHALDPAEIERRRIDGTAQTLVELGMRPRILK